MKSMWKGGISFGMVNIPVKMYKATESGSSVPLTSMHIACGTAVKEPKYCLKCEKILESSEIQKAYAEDKKKTILIPVTDEDLASIPLDSAHVIKIDGFRQNIPDIRYYDSSYILEPDELGMKAFALLEQGLTQANKIGIAKIATAQKEHLCGIMPTGDGLMYLITLQWAEDIRSTEGLQRPKVQITEKEAKMAGMLIEMMPQDVDLTSYSNEAGAALKKLIEAKKSGLTLEPLKIEKPKELDLDALLAASLQMAGAK